MLILFVSFGVSIVQCHLCCTKSRSVRETKQPAFGYMTRIVAADNDERSLISLPTFTAEVRREYG